MRHRYSSSNAGRLTHRGFSLVELMVALALSTFLIGGLILTYVSGRTAARDAEELSRIQENMRFISDHLLRDIRNAGFRDQLTLTFSQFEQIGQSFAQVNNDGTELTIRYAGRSHCAQSRQGFDPNNPVDLTVVTNRFFAEAGRLRCEGSGPGDPRTTQLVTGVTSVEFALLRPPGVALTGIDPLVCNFDTDEDLETACIGVRMTVTFDGQNGQRSAVMDASFRNVLVDRIYGRD